MTYAYLMVTTTFDSESAAKALARQLVERRLAACVHISGPVISVYRWQGKIEEATEWTCTIKTRSSTVERLRQAISDLHPYDVPEFVATPISEASADYAKWIDEQID